MRSKQLVTQQEAMSTISLSGTLLVTARQPIQKELSSARAENSGVDGPSNTLVI